NRRDRAGRGFSEAECRAGQQLELHKRGAACAHGTNAAELAGLAEQGGVRVHEGQKAACFEPQAQPFADRDPQTPAEGKGKVRAVIGATDVRGEARGSNRREQVWRKPAGLASDQRSADVQILDIDTQRTERRVALERSLLAPVEELIL